MTDALTPAASLPPLDFGDPLWLFDDRTIAAMLHEAASFVSDPAVDADLRGTAEAVRQHVELQAMLRGVEASPLPPADAAGSALLAALEQARLDLIAAWMACPERSTCSSFETAVTVFGCPEAITRATDALRAATPTA